MDLAKEVRVSRPLAQAEALLNFDKGASPAIQQNQFFHSQLPGDRYIRLLRIIQSHSEPFVITIEAIPLQHRPDYEALSYTWGKALLTDCEERDNDHEKTHEILVNGKSFMITKNLHDGLFALRNDVTGYLWIDSLCIDQANIQERATQVSLMGDIYSSAARVIIWLGDTVSQDLLDVIWLIERWLPIAGNFPAEELNSDLMAVLNITKERWFILWENYGNFYSSYRWFSRAWVVQELLLARDIVIRCGSIIVDLESLKILALTALEARVPIISVQPADFLRLLAIRAFIVDGDIMEGLWALNTRAQTSEERWYSWVMHLIYVIRCQSASNLHDKIYAVFGIAQKSLPPDIDHTKTTDRLIVNYEQPLEEAYSSFAAELLKSMPTLALLSLVEPHSRGTKRKLESLPSWCPDFSIKSRINPLFMANYRSIDGYTCVIVFAATKRLERENGSCEVTGRVLSVSGKRVASIAKAGKETGPVFDTEIPQKSPGCEGFFDSCRELDPVYILTGQDRVEVLWRTLMLDNTSAAGDLGGYPNAKLFSLAFGAFVCVHSSFAVGRMEQMEAEEFLQIIAKRELDFNSSSILLPNLPGIIETAEVLMDDPLSPLIEGSKSLANEFWLRAKQHTAGRRLFTTESKWLGLGPLHLEEGDEVWLLKNAKVPFVLRSLGDSKYRLIGEAYVHGIMQGELVDAPGGSEGFQEIEIV